MLPKTTKPQKDKETIVSSMARKLADVSAADEIKKSKKRKKLPLYFYLIVFTIMSGISVLFYLPRKQTFENENKQIEVPRQVQSPLTLLTDAFKSDSISADQYALYLKDILIRYDSLPGKFKTKKPIIVDNDVYLSIMNVWTRLSLRIRATLLKELPDLEKKVERLRDSLGIRY